MRVCKNESFSVNTCDWRRESTLGVANGAKVKEVRNHCWLRTYVVLVVGEVEVGICKDLDTRCKGGDWRSWKGLGNGEGLRGQRSMS